MKQLFFLFCLFTFFICKSQNQKDEREAFKLELAVDAKSYYSMDVPKSAYFVREKILQIYPGEKLLIETEIKGDSIFSMKVVRENKHPERTITLDFSQDAKDKNNISMMLNVKNPFNRTLNYNALMYTPKNQKWKSTSIIPILPKIQSSEMWSHAIITLVLEKWRFE